MSSTGLPSVAVDGVLDTSTVIALGQLDPATLPIFPAITSVTLAELSAGPLAARNEHDRRARQLQLQLVESSFDPLPFDSDAARAFGQVAASLRANGRTTAARAYDALIAATALSRALPVYTLNPAAYAGIDGLDVRVPSEPLPLSPDERERASTHGKQ